MSTENHFPFTARRFLLSTLCLLIPHLTVHSQVPRFNSNSASNATVYLDFDGHYVTGTIWNWDSSFQARPSGLSQETMLEVFNRVAEDYRIFNINITTDSQVFAGAPIDKRVRVIITPTNNWYGAAGGVAIVGSFTTGDNTPAWVFSNLLENNPKYVGEAVSHEIGHTLGLQHQSSYDENCSMVTEYAEGRGDGEISWAPIMGVGYYRNLTTWHTGASVEGCDIIQNDIETISEGNNHIGLRTDDHGNNLNNASPLEWHATSFQSNGVISNSNDKDVFSFKLDKEASFRSSITPNHVALANSGANIDIKVSLISAYGDTIGSYNPAEGLSVPIDTILYAGIYYLVVDGVGNANISDYGSIGYYSIDGSINATLPITRLQLTGKAKGPTHLLNWNFLTDLSVNFSEVESSVDGIHFTALNKVDPSVKHLEYNPFGNKSLFYRVKLISGSNKKAFYSNTVSLDAPVTGGISLVSNLIRNTAQVNSNASYNYVLLDETGRTLQQGTINAGLNNVPVNTLKHGLLLLKVYKGKEQQLFKLIKQ